MNIIFEDKNILVIEKERGVPVQNDKTCDKSLAFSVSEYLKEKKEGEAFVVHRLDRPVGGIIVFAKNKKASAFLSLQIQEKSFEKTYLAVVCGKLKENKGILCDYLIKNQSLNISKVVHKNMRGAKKALLEYEVINTVEKDMNTTLSLVRIKLLTGRHHQIRVQFANMGCPLWGDTKYNPEFKHHRGFTYTALWAYKLELLKPFTNERSSFEIKPPKEFPFSEFKEI